MNKPTRGGKRQGAGRKPAPEGPATARLNIKCRPDELAAWKAAARVGLSQWVRDTLNKKAPPVEG